MGSVYQIDFAKGRGIDYEAVYHLLYGSGKSRKGSDVQSGNELYFFDENLKGYGWRDSDIEEINELEMQLGTAPKEILDLRTMIDFCCIWRYDYPQRILHICRAIGGSGDTTSRCHYQVGTDMREELTAYATALKKWIGGSTAVGEPLSGNSEI